MKLISIILIIISILMIVGLFLATPYPPEEYMDDEELGNNEYDDNETI